MGVGEERKRASGCVPVGSVVPKRIRSNGCVVSGGGVEEKRCRTNCRIISSIVIEQRAGADTGAEGGVGVGPERNPSKCRIEYANGRVHVEEG
jgi:hypothetical protein